VKVANTPTSPPSIAMSSLNSTGTIMGKSFKNDSLVPPFEWCGRFLTTMPRAIDLELLQLLEDKLGKERA